MQSLLSTWSPHVHVRALPAHVGPQRTLKPALEKSRRRSFVLNCWVSYCAGRAASTRRSSLHWCGEAPESSKAGHVQACARKTLKGLAKSERLQRLKDHASTKGGACLAKSYSNNRTKVLWECRHGHTWHATPQNVLNGKRWCPECARNRQRGSLERLQEHAKSRGGKCVSTEYKTNRSKYRWQCKFGHCWEAAAYSVLNHGTWWPACARKGGSREKRSLVDLRAHASSRGGCCLATEYSGVMRKVLWKCENGHTWRATPSSVKHHNTWCPVCAQRAPVRLERLRRHAEQLGGQCLATEYFNNRSKLMWRCKHGHVWQATVNGVLHKGTWCPHCRKIGLETLRAHAASLGGKCLAMSYKNSHTKLLWECRKGHRWKATAHSLLHGKSWCPECATSTWRTEAEVRSIFESIFYPATFATCYPTFLGGLQLDGYCPELSLAFEYQGEQHYDPDNYFHFGDRSSFEAQQERDARKLKLCRAQGVHLVLVPCFVNDKRTFVLTCLLHRFSIAAITRKALANQDYSEGSCQLDHGCARR